MWPLAGRDIAEACGISGVPPALARVCIAGVALSESDVAGDDQVFIAIRDGDWDGHAEAARALERGAPLAVVARGWQGLAALEPARRERCLVVDDTLVAFRRLAAFLRARFSFPVVAVGESNGKTTTKEMIAAVLSGARRYVTKTPETMNGWSGIPLTLTLRGHARAAPPSAVVVEVGIDAVGAMADHAKLVDADVAVITALGPEHREGE